MAFGRERIQELELDNERLSAGLDAAQEELRRTQDELRIAQAAARIVPDLQAAVRGFYDDPNIIELAEQKARDMVIADEQAQYTQQVADRLVVEKGDGYRAQWRAQNADKVRAEQDAQNERDGTYAALEVQVDQEERGAIQAQLLEERKAQYRAELTTPASRAKIVAELRAQLDDSDAMRTFRADTRLELQDGWDDEARRQAQQEIRAEEAAREDEYVEKAKADYKKSPEGQRKRDQIRTELHRQWDKRALEEVAHELHDDELLELLAKRAKQEKAKLERETKTAALLESFTRGGVDTDAIEENSKVRLYLGEIGQTEKDVPVQGDYYNRTEKKKMSQMVCRRALTLTALGAGRFIVDHDSFADISSSDPLWSAVQDNVIEQGVVIVIGRKLSDNGNSQLRHVVESGVELFFDDDTSTPNITGMKLSVANIEIDGIQARKFDDVVMPGDRASRKS